MYQVFITRSGLNTLFRLYTAFYYENFARLLPLTKGEDGKLSAHWPLLWTDGPIGVYAAADTGAYVKEALKNPERWIGTFILASSC